MNLLKISNDKLAYFCFRFALGISILMHGLVRIPKLGEFANWVSTNFENTIISGYSSLLFGYTVPIVEVSIGILILLGGKFIRYGLALGMILMGILMFGSCLIEKWEWLVSQLIHLGLFYALLINKNTPDYTK
ncbi:MAG: DoxX family protein [uncultured Campylobacterales bacterium]|uniref:DoxX family protein n=1 Tax=uncultured Campylobacterales bacterium TaxID=352960 RepID=A0A6S6S052_9BACT|nr:MAG: DoxX family protein [uncultured Campylobacterales bacterium]